MWLSHGSTAAGTVSCEGVWMATQTQEECLFLESLKQWHHSQYFPQTQHLTGVCEGRVQVHQRSDSKYADIESAFAGHFRIDKILYGWGGKLILDRHAYLHKLDVHGFSL